MAPRRVGVGIRRIERGKVHAGDLKVQQLEKKGEKSQKEGGDIPERRKRKERRVCKRWAKKKDRVMLDGTALPLSKTVRVREKGGGEGGLQEKEA